MQTATSKDSPVSLSSETESSSDESESEYESDASPPPEKSPLPVTRPQKAVEAVRYDTIKAVWLPRNKFAPNDLILKGLADLWEVVRTIRDRWKADKEAVKKATEAKQESELPLLRERVDKQLEMMEAVLTAASEFGHADLLGAYVFPSLHSLIHSSLAMCTSKKSRHSFQLGRICDHRLCCCTRIRDRACCDICALQVDHQQSCNGTIVGRTWCFRVCCNLREKHDRGDIANIHPHVLSISMSLQCGHKNWPASSIPRNTC